jgi:hypothetical protein
MKRGDIVAWKFRVEMGIPSEVGVIVSRLTLSHDPWPYWRVLFSERGVLQCRESDLVEV